jgi:IclR family transcriptional regulator, arginine deiminase pathway regulator
MNDTKTSSRTLSTVSTTFRIIDALEQLGEATAIELMSELDLSKSAVYNHLTTLKQHGYIVQEGDSYSLSLEFLRLGEFVRNRNRLYVTAQPRLVELAESTGEYAHLSTEEHGRLMHIWKVKGEHAVGQRFQKNKMQKTDCLHYTATGKAILAHLPESRRQDIVQSSELVRKTENTITAPEALEEELDTIRSRGYAYNDEEQIKGLRAVGAPICDKDGYVLGAISISGPTSRIKSDEFRKHVPEVVTRTANIIEVDLNMDSR